MIIVGLVTNNKFITDVSAIIWVEGHITSDTTWTPVDTYRVINDTYVDPGVTLTIEPGVHVQFADGFSLIVEGTFSAIGTDTHPIVFTSSQIDPNPGVWDTISFVGDQDESLKLSFTIVEFAKNGLTLNGEGQVTIERSKFSNNLQSGIYYKKGKILAIKHNTIIQNSKGITSSTSILSDILISNNSISSNYGGGIYFDADVVSNVTLRDNLLDSNGLGIGFASKTIINNLMISDNRVTGNEGKGILICDQTPGDSSIVNVTVSGNMIVENVGSGLVFRCSAQYLYGQTRFAAIDNVTISRNNISLNTGRGVSLSSDADSPHSSIRNIHLSNNHISANGDDAVWMSTYCKWSHVQGYEGGLIEKVTLMNNTISGNNGNGIFFKASAWEEPTFSNINIMDNKVVASGKNGIYFLTSTEWPNTYITNLTIMNNDLISNIGYAIYFEERSTSGITISHNLISYSTTGVYAAGSGDLIAVGNVISMNYEKGVFFKSLETNLSNNLFQYNNQAILYDSTVKNLAHYNDIYANTYGMNVTNGATVNAEYNYWGHSTGPYHPSLNPEGEGNPVNGDGTDLDFIPFLTSPIGAINERPVAILEVDKTTPNFNETVTFDATGSSDDGRIDYYFFDFGDGTNSGWTTLPVVTHKYALNGTYNAVLIVMDDFGVTSLDSNYVEITVQAPGSQIEVTISSDIDILKYEKNEAKIRVNVKNTGGYVARDVSVSVEIPHNIETENETSWEGDLPPNNEVEIYLDVKARYCTNGTLEVKVTYLDEENKTVEIFEYLPIVVKDYIILAHENGWTDVNLSPLIVEKCKGWSAENVASSIWVNTMLMEVGDLLDTGNITTLLEHAEEFWEWIEILIEKGEVSLELLAFLIDIVGGLAMNSIGLYLCTTTGRGEFYEDGTMDFRAGWPVSMLRSLLNETAHIVVDAITDGTEEPENISSNFVYLEDPEGRIYLHVFVEGEEINVYYAENKFLAIIPSNATNIRYIIDASEAEKSREEYTVAYFGIRNGEVIEQRIITDEIIKGEEQEYEIQTEDGKVKSIKRTFDVTWEEEIYPVTVFSNSTVSGLKFDQLNKQINFNITGEEGTHGFCNITIPKELLYAQPNDWTVEIDGEPPLSLIPNQNEIHMFLYFTYEHGQTVRIIGTEVISEFPMFMILSLLLILSSISFVLGSWLRKQRKT